MSSLFFETERLLLRPLTFSDSLFTIELLNTEGYLTYIANRNVHTTAQAEDYLRNGPLKSYETYGFGISLVALKHSHQPIGMCGLLKRDYLEHPDIGFAFLPQYMSQGYAYEVASQTVQFGFAHLGLEKILGITLPTNVASIKLLERLGLLYEQRVVNETGEELCLYGISARYISHQRGLTEVR